MYAVIPTLGIIRYVHIGSFPQTRLPLGMITYIHTSITQPLLLQSAYLMGGFLFSNTKAVVGS